MAIPADTFMNELKWSVRALEKMGVEVNFYDHAREIPIPRSALSGAAADEVRNLPLIPPEDGQPRTWARFKLPIEGWSLVVYDWFQLKAEEPSASVAGTT